LGLLAFDDIGSLSRSRFFFSLHIAQNGDGKGTRYNEYTHFSLELYHFKRRKFWYYNYIKTLNFQKLTKTFYSVVKIWELYSCIESIAWSSSYQKRFYNRETRTASNYEIYQISFIPSPVPSNSNDLFFPNWRISANHDKTDGVSANGEILIKRVVSLFYNLFYHNQPNYINYKTFNQTENVGDFSSYKIYQGQICDIFCI
jgi:hypothetical protein